MEIPLDLSGENLKFWNKLSSMTSYQDNLGILLKLGSDLPDTVKNIKHRQLLNNGDHIILKL